MKTFEPPRTLEMGGDGNGLYPPGDEKGRSYYYWNETLASCRAVLRRGCFGPALVA